VRWATYADVALDVAHDALDVLARGVRADHDADAALAVTRLDDELVDLREGRAALLLVDEVERAHGGHERLLVEVEADHLLDVGMDRLVVGDAGAKPVDEAQAASSQGSHGNCARSPGST